MKPIRLLVVVALFATGCAGRTRAAPPDDLVVRWNAALLQAVRDSRLGPPMVARALAVVHTSMYDAWAAYDDRAAGTRYRTKAGGGSRRDAISSAAYLAAADLFPASEPRFRELRGGATSPIGDAAAAAVLEFRHQDGSNQLAGYADYTGYTPVNDPMVVDVFGPPVLRDPNRWQPLTYGGATPRFLAPQWNRVAPFALSSDSEFRSKTGPVKSGTPEFERQAQQLVDISAALNERQKMIAEYWADGPNSETPPGHWNLFAEQIARRERLGLDESIKLFFVLNNALLDASIASWDDKVAFDSVRPITAIRQLFAGRTIRAWGGPGRGTIEMDGGAWTPYQLPTFPTPPFAEYSSGHSTFSAAGAEVLKRFTGSDRFGYTVTRPAGSSRVEPGVVPAKDVVLHFATFSAAAAQAGLSRRYGGIHFEAGDLEGRSCGRLVGRRAWTTANAYFSGRAPGLTPSTAS